MANKDNDYNAILLEKVHDQNERLLEAVGALSGVPQDIAAIKEDVSQLKSDVAIIKSVVKDHSVQLASQEQQITELQTA